MFCLHLLEIKSFFSKLVFVTSIHTCTHSACVFFVLPKTYYIPSIGQQYFNNKPTQAFPSYHFYFSRRVPHQIHNVSENFKPMFSDPLKQSLFERTNWNMLLKHGLNILKCLAAGEKWPIDLLRYLSNLRFYNFCSIQILCTHITPPTT